MKSSEITVGQDYAVVTYGKARDGLNDDFLSHATVVQTLDSGVTAQILVRVEGHENENVLRPVQIIGTWEAYVKSQADKRASEKSRKDRMRSTTESILAFVPKGAELPWWATGEVFPDGSYATGGSLTLDELRALLKAAYLHGKARS